MLVLSQLYARFGDLLPGTIPGTCYICAEHTDIGSARPPSDAFTDWARCYAGDVVCPSCLAMLKQPALRRQSWVMTEADVRFQTADHPQLIYAALRDPPPPPFAIYLTRAGQKQGWITLARRVSTSMQYFWVGTDWLDAPVLINHQWICEVDPIRQQLRQLGISLPKLTGEQLLTPKDYERAWKVDALSALQKLQQLQQSPAWEVLVYAGR